MKFKSFIEENFLIDNAETGAYVPFKFNSVQSKYYQILVNEYGEDLNFSNLREIVLKARKEGFTSLILAIFASSMILSETAVRFLEISYKDDATRQHFRRFKNFILSFVTHDFKAWNSDLDKQIFKSTAEGAELVLKSNSASFYVGTASTKTGERGGTVQGVLFSEEAHYPNTGIIKASEIIDGTSSMVAVDHGMIFRETTANGFNHFRTSWNMAKSGELNYRPRFFGWKEFYTPQQFESIKLGFSDKSLIPQEFPDTPSEAFLSSGRPVFNQKRLNVMESRCGDSMYKGDLMDDGSKIELIESKQGKLSIWKVPREGRSYLISGDVAKGIIDGAWSVACVFDRSSWEVVAEFRDRLDPGKFGKVMVDLGYFYKNAVLVPENNNHGAATLERIVHTEEYPHVLMTNTLWADDKNPDYGFPTNERTKELIVSALNNAIDQQSYFENSKVAVNEMLGAVRDANGKMVSEGGFLDCVITRGIGLYCLKFLTVDETYRDSETRNRSIVVSSTVGRSRERHGSTGYR